MKLIRIILGRLGYVKRSGTSNPSQWLIDWVGGGAESSSGVKVNESSALKYTPFWSAVRVISGTVAALPFKVYRRIAGGKDKVPDHPVYKLLNSRPNQYMDSVTFIETRQAHVLTYGNGYAEIQRDGGGRPIALWPLLPDRTERKITKEGVPYYEVRQTAGETVPLPDYNVLHIKGLGFDGYTGYNVVAYHKEAIGYGVAVKQFGSRFFGNDASPGGVLEHPETLSDTAVKHLEEFWEKSHKGLSQSHRMQVLEEGMKWAKTGVDPEQAQALETQKYTVDDCSRIFNIPPHKLGSMDRATFSNIEEQNIDFVTMTMLYWFRKWEQECNYKLFMPNEFGKVFCEILVEGLLRGKTLSRYQAYNIGRNAGFLCVDDIREKENMNSLPDGKGQIFLEPLNMKEAGSESPANDTIRKAHRDLILSQVLRIIRKSFPSFEAQRKFANTILYEPVNAYASTFNSGNMEIRGILDNTVNELITDKLTEEDAGMLASKIMQKIGGNYHAVTKT